MISQVGEKTVTCTIVGDGMVGKSQLCKTFVGDLTIEDYKATVTDEHEVLIKLMGDKYSLRIVDSSGQVSLKQLDIYECFLFFVFTFYFNIVKFI